jgi:hypothetical protein
VKGESHQSDHPDDVPPGPITWFTVAGRLLLIVTMILTGGLMYWYVFATVPELPAGSYPVVMWAFPLLITGFLFFWLTAFVLERLGIRIYRRD